MAVAQLQRTCDGLLLLLGVLKSSQPDCRNTGSSIKLEGLDLGLEALREASQRGLCSGQTMRPTEKMAQHIREYKSVKCLISGTPILHSTQSPASARAVEPAPHAVRTGRPTHQLRIQHAGILSQTGRSDIHSRREECKWGHRHMTSLPVHITDRTVVCHSRPRKPGSLLS